MPSVYLLNGTPFLVYRLFAGTVWNIKASPGHGDYCDKHTRFVTESEVISHLLARFSITRTGLFQQGACSWSIISYAQNVYPGVIMFQKEKIPLGTHIGVPEKYQCYHYPLTKLAYYEKVFHSAIRGSFHLF